MPTATITQLLQHIYIYMWVYLNNTFFLPLLNGMFVAISMTDRQFRTYFKLISRNFVEKSVASLHFTYIVNGTVDFPFFPGPSAKT